MKKIIFLIAAILFLTQFSKAQTEKGDQTLGANLGFMFYQENSLVVDQYSNSSGTQDTKFTQFNIGPTYSYFIADKLDIGTSLYYSSNVMNYSGNDPYQMKNGEKTYNGSIFARKYFMYKDKIGFRTGPYISYEKQNQQITYAPSNSIDNQKINSDIYTAGANLELVYYPSKHLGVSARIADLNYEHISTDNGSQGNSKENDVNFNFINQGLYLSVYYTFGG